MNNAIDRLNTIVHVVLKKVVDNENEIAAIKGISLQSTRSPSVENDASIQKQMASSIEMLEQQMQAITTELANVRGVVASIETKNIVKTEPIVADATAVGLSLSTEAFEKKFLSDMKREIAKEKTLIEASIMGKIETIIPKLLSERLASVQHNLDHLIDEKLASSIKNAQAHEDRSNQSATVGEDYIDIVVQSSSEKSNDDDSNSGIQKRKYKKKINAITV
jgi:hypothetical protein